MANLEQIPTSYKPHLNTIWELIDQQKTMNREAILLEIAHFKYELGQETMDLMAATRNLKPKDKKNLVRLISLVALSDLPEAEEMIEEEDKTAILTAIKLVKSFKHTIKTEH